MKTALCIDMEDLLDHFFKTRYGAEVEFDGEYLHKGRDYSEVIIPHYKVVSDPEGSLTGFHEVILEDD